MVGDIAVHPVGDEVRAQGQLRHIHGGERLTGLAAFPESARACSRLPTGAADRVKARPRLEVAADADGRNHAMVSAGADTNLVASCFSSLGKILPPPTHAGHPPRGRPDGVDG